MHPFDLSFVGLARHGSDMTTRLDLYLKEMSKLGEAMCAPFWWSLKRDTDEKARIVGIGTVSYVDTGTQKIGVSADHVYQDYLKHLAEYGPDAVECQFGGSTIRPQNHLIDRSEELDVVTFDVPAVFVSASQRNPKAYHSAPQWPPRRLCQSEVALYGGFPANLHEEKGPVAELPFQWAAGRVDDVSQDDVILQPDFKKMRWQGDETNSEIVGWSGGPVFRVVENQPIARLEWAGVMYVYSGKKKVRARHADVILSDGRLRRS